jgi:ABC-type uncharacterized transport system involved in gliding motility auxiliary subunit
MLNRILNVAGWVGIALVFGTLLATLSGRLGPEWDPYIRWARYAGFASIVLYMLGQWREIGRLFQGRQARLGSMALVSVVAVLGILVILNYLASREKKRWDLTKNQIYSLSEQTTKLVGGLSSPVKILLFAPEDEFPSYRDRLDGYANASKQVSVEYIDTAKRPALAKQYDVQVNGTTVFEYMGRVERVTTNTEQDLTNGLIKVLAGKEHKAYFTSGHGEHDPTNSDRRLGYSGIAAGLARDNFKVEKLVLAQESDVPADATLVVVAGPTADFFPPEIEALKRYITKGGKVLFMVDPPDKADSPALSNLVALIEEWGVQLGNDIVVDVSGMGQLLGTGPEVPVAATYPPHAITEGFTFVTAYPTARSVTPMPGAGADKPVAQAFVQTSPRSWAEADIKGLITTGEVAMDPAKGDKQGPISLAVAVSAPVGGQPATPAKPDEPPKPEIRLAVLGDSDFVANYTGNIRGNADLFLNTVNWLAQQENLIAIRPRQPEDRRITMTAAQQRYVMLLSMLLVPGTILGAGIYTWWRRR